MAKTKDEFIEILMEIAKKKKQLDDLAAARHAEETALMTEYRVNEVNQKRDALVKKYFDLQNPINQEIATLQTELGI